MTCLTLPKHCSSLHWKTSPATVAPNGITVYLNHPSSVLKVLRKNETSLSCWCQYPFLQSCTDMIHASANRWAMSSGVVEMIGFLHSHFIKVAGVQADSKLQVTSLVFPLNKHKAVNPWGGFMYWLQNPTFSILSFSCLKAFFKCTGICLQGVCLGVIIGSSCIWYGGPGDHSIPSKTSG